MEIFNFEFYKRIGFYFSVASIVTLIAAVFSYLTGFTGVLLEYNSPNVIIIAIVAVLAFFALLIVDFTSGVAPVVLWAGSFATFLLYVTNIYMYFTGIFYNGVSQEAFQLIDPAVVTSTVLFLISFIIANVAMYMNHSQKEEV